jgi:hypothetical protein
MKYVHLTWYLLEDGTHADPNDVAPDKAGVLRHKNGLAVGLHADGTPMSVGKGAVENKNVEAAEAAKEPETEPVTADIEPVAEPPAEPTPRKAGYKTRESKAR